MSSRDIGVERASKETCQLTQEMFIALLFAVNAIPLLDKRVPPKSPKTDAQIKGNNVNSV